MQQTFTCMTYSNRDREIQKMEDYWKEIRFILIHPTDEDVTGILHIFSHFRAHGEDYKWAEFQVKSFPCLENCQNIKQRWKLEKFELKVEINLMQDDARLLQLLINSFQKYHNSFWVNVISSSDKQKNHSYFPELFSLHI